MAPVRQAVKRRGILELSTPISHFSGPALIRKGVALVGRSSAELSARAGGTHPALPERLIRLLIEVSDTFGAPIAW